MRPEGWTGVVCTPWNLTDPPPLQSQKVKGIWLVSILDGLLDRPTGCLEGLLTFLVRKLIKRLQRAVK